MTQGFIPVQIPSPPVRSYYANIGPQYYQPQLGLSNHPIANYRSGRSRTFPRSYNRMLRAPPELASPILNLNLNILEQSPESQSSSSGFGSKNTSSHQNQSSQSGGTANEWRLPPYRPPPQPTSSLHHPSQYSYHDSLVNSPSSQYSMSHWFELMQRLNLASASEFKAVDVGSVDGHYEFGQYFLHFRCFIYSFIYFLHGPRPIDSNAHCIDTDRSRRITASSSAISTAPDTTCKRSFWHAANETYTTQSTATLRPVDN